MNLQSLVIICSMDRFKQALIEQGWEPTKFSSIRFAERILEQNSVLATIATRDNGETGIIVSWGSANGFCIRYDTDYSRLSTLVKHHDINQAIDEALVAIGKL